MRKYFRVSGLFLCILMLYSCGGADPLETGTVTLTADVTSVEARGSCTLTATVTNLTSAGVSVPVVGEKVTFDLLTANGGSISVSNNKTASGGVARATYTAGNNLFSDVIRVTTSVGATASITITKTGAPRGKVVALSATLTSVAPLGFSTITATVTDNELAVQGERVTFALLTNNGASLTVQSGLTNASGQVITTYWAGNNQNQDVIQASLANGATAQVIITKTGGIRGLVVALTPTSPISVMPLGFSTITATVTDNGVAVPGERVTFALLTNNEASLTVQSGFTNASGQMTTVYQAGNNNSQDVVQAALSNGATAQVIITKTGVGPGVSITLISEPNPVVPGGSSIITATVRDSGNNLVSGVLVRFSMTTSNGSLSRSDLITDGSGVAKIVYYAGNNLSPDILQAITDGGFTSLIITKTGQVSGYTATLVTSPSSVTGGDPNDVGLTVTVVDNNSLPAQGMRVRFNQPHNIDQPTLYVGYITPDNALTGVDGKVTATFYYSGDTAVPGGAGPYEQIEINAYVDVNDNGTYDQGEPTAQDNIDVI